MVHRHGLVVGEELEPEQLTALWTEAVHAAVRQLERTEYRTPARRQILEEVRPESGQTIRIHCRRVSTEGGIEGHLRRILTYLSKPRIRLEDAPQSAERIAALEVALGGSRWVQTAGGLFAVGGRRRKWCPRRRAARRGTLRPLARRASPAAASAPTCSPAEVMRLPVPPTSAARSLAQRIVRAVTWVAAIGHTVRQGLAALVIRSIGAARNNADRAESPTRNTRSGPRGPPGR
jgi:hypothetical protein